MAALEQLLVVLLDTKHRILGTRTVYQGSVNQTQDRLPYGLWAWLRLEGGFGRRDPSVLRMTRCLC